MALVPVGDPELDLDIDIRGASNINTTITDNYSKTVYPEFNPSVYVNNSYEGRAYNVGYYDDIDISVNKQSSHSGFQTAVSGVRLGTSHSDNGRNYFWEKGDNLLDDTFSEFRLEIRVTDGGGGQGSVNVEYGGGEYTLDKYNWYSGDYYDTGWMSLSSIPTAIGTDLSYYEEWTQGEATIHLKPDVSQVVSCSVSIDSVSTR